MEDLSCLVPSELGTKEYWQTIYDREKKNFNTYGDPGDIWFGEESEQRILQWLEKRRISKVKSVVDIGCGNGMMLIAMRREGFTNLTGCDYCENAIELAKAVTTSYSIDDIKFEVLDIISEKFHSTFDIAMDKGTYDAISLDPDNAAEKQKKYVSNVAQMLNEDGILIITSCNWTDEEIRQQFKQEFDYMETIPTPKFMFGGKVGNVVSTLVLQKKH